MSQYQTQSNIPGQPLSYPHSAESYNMAQGQPPQQPTAAHPQQMNYEKQEYYQNASNGLHANVHGQANAYAHGKGSKFGNKWTFGFWDCVSPFGLSCLACWCPCVVFGKTYDREHGVADSSGLNVMCLAHCCAINFGVSGCLQCIIRGQTREKYGIESSAVNDFCAGCCCPCCSLVQEEKESLVRNTGVDPKTGVQYQPVGQGMSYSA